MLFLQKFWESFKALSEDEEGRYFSTSSNTSARTAIQRKLAFAAWSTSSDKELKVSNLLLDAISNNKAYGKSLAATEHKDTILGEDKQILGNFVLCLRNARFDIVCFGSMAEEAQVELCVVFNCYWHQGDFCKFSWKNMFWTCFGLPVWWILMRFVWTGFMGFTNLQTKFMGIYKPREFQWDQMGRDNYKPL